MYRKLKRHEMKGKKVKASKDFYKPMGSGVL
jgi:hypothetical protein